MKKLVSGMLAIAMTMVFISLFTAAATSTEIAQVTGANTNSLIGESSYTLETLSDSSGISFSDLREEHWAYKDIMALVGMGALNGYQDGTFRPNNNLTLGEMAKIVSEVFYVVNPEGYTFPDFDPEFDFMFGPDERNKWYAPYAKDIYHYYYSGFDGPGEFGGARPAIRRDVVNVLVNVLYKTYDSGEWTFGYDVPDGYMEYLGETFTDIRKHLADEYVNESWWWSPYDSYEHWYIASKVGIITGYTDGSFRHYGNISRAEFCAMVNRALALRDSI